MKKRLTSSLSDEQIEVLKEAATMGRVALERLVVVLKEYEDEAVRDMTRDEHFVGEWTAKQATLVGEVKSMRKIQEIVNSLLTKRN